MKYSAFIFEDYTFDEIRNEIVMKYSFDGELHFKERISWQVDSINYNPNILDRALFGLWLMCGVSYYKAYVPSKIIIKKGSLSREQKEFFDEIYLHGLAQFFYTNSLDWKGHIDFPFDTNNGMKLDESTNSSGSLIAIGGGKDSIVAAETIKSLDDDFDCWAVNQSKRFEPIAQKLNSKMLPVIREIDPKLLELNSKDALSGHVPITAINSFIGLVLAILVGRQRMVWAIESSTDEPNTIWQGLEVNHQYSKTSYFEQAMQNYINKFVAKDLEYFSTLRSITELRIAEIFCKNYIDKYQGLFSSCNANFTIGKTDELAWCGKCPKCAFVFTLFAPFLDKNKLVSIFGGNNIFADPDMKGTLEELLGIDGHKPLECVGEIAEVRKAVELAKKTDQYPELKQFNYPFEDFDYKKWGANAIPSELEPGIKKLLLNL